MMQSTRKAQGTEALGTRPLLDLVEIEAGVAPESSVPVAPALAYGVVLENDDLTVAVDGRERAARRAKSCLVAPEPGDRVLLSVDGTTAYVLAVLDGAVDTKVVTGGKLEIRAEDLSLAGERVAVNGGAVTIAADALRMRAKSAIAALDELKLFGGSIEANVADRAVLLAERVETRATRLLQRTKQLFRFVEDVEQARVGNYDLRAEGLAAVRAENTIVSARVLAKLDGEQVKIG